ncbi:MFS transporter [Desulfogranum mediterraneum]|uniref:MFS transporter n=1 Tax=Desulfogranum mediterraneum TaxID=160661 RepID=UPI00048BCD7C|nr:MFS transporter [Desulfogranum mediterraneum]
MQTTISPFSLTNIRLFILFRVLFNARFYYPVFTILFLDYGLSIEQFALLNTVWAFTIVLAEVPSGALADLLGRKRLLVGTTLLMMAEMALIAFVPLGNISLIFSVFLVNRILSGLAEAMASGADEAMAYDTLVEAGIADQWPRVLDLQMRAQNIGYIFAMTLGALAYDPGMVNTCIHWLGWEGSVDQQVTMRYPLYLTLLLGILAWLTTLQMRDPQVVNGSINLDTAGRVRMIEVLRMTLGAGGWILRTPFALAIILFAMSFDHTLRMIVTMTSQYYRLIQLPEASFGLIGSAVALLGLFVPRVARWLSEHYSPQKNVLLLLALALATLFGLTLFIPYLGLFPMMLVFIGMMLTSFFTSHYLNQITSSDHRATVLSFKGLAFNAAYGLIGIFYALLISRLRAQQGALHPDWLPEEVGDAAFEASISWFPWYLLAVLALVALLSLPRMRKKELEQIGKGR